MQPLAEYELGAFNTLAVPSTAAFFVECAHPDDIKAALAWAKSRKLGVAILGGGSNVLLPRRIDALVIRPAFLGITVLPGEQTSAHYFLRVGAGENWHDFVGWTLSNHLPGLENLSLIPGTVGAAPVQNIGAYGVEVGDYIHTVHCIDLHSGEAMRFTQQQCAFAYRDSIFKQQQPARYVITAVDFILPKQWQPQLAYPALAQHITEAGLDLAEVTPRVVSEAVIAVRKSKLPQPEILPNAGSFFKNPVVSAQCYQQLKAHYPKLVAFAMNDHYKLAAGWLIEQAGWKGRMAHGVRVHEQQALVLTNPNRLDITAVLACAKVIQVEVRQRYGVDLDIEPQVLEPRQLGA